VYRAVWKVPSMKHSIVQVRGNVRFLLHLPSAVQYVLIILFQFNSACTWSSNASSFQWMVFQSNIFIIILLEFCFRHCALQPAKFCLFSQICYFLYTDLFFLFYPVQPLVSLNLLRRSGYYMHCQI
jgi:hypothetical protein